MKKYFGSESLQDLIDELYEVETSLFYKDTEYQTWLDGSGWCIGFLGYIGDSNPNIPNDAYDKSIRAYRTLEDMIENYVLHDGTRLKDAVEMDCIGWGKYYTGEPTTPMPEWPDKLVEKEKD